MRRIAKARALAGSGGAVEGRTRGRVMGSDSESDSVEGAGKKTDSPVLEERIRASMTGCEC